MLNIVKKIDSGEEKFFSGKAFYLGRWMTYLTTSRRVARIANYRKYLLATSKYKPHQGKKECARRRVGRRGWRI